MSAVSWPWEGEYEAQFLQTDHIQAVIDDLELRNSHIVLDAGCGNGTLSIAVAKQCSEGIVVACDIDDAAIRNTIEKAKQVPNLFVTKTCLDDLPPHPRGYDRIICRNVLHFVANSTLVLQRLSNLLRSGGWLLLEFPAARTATESAWLESISLKWDSSRRRSYYLSDDIQATLAEFGCTLVLSNVRVVLRSFPTPDAGSLQPNCRAIESGGIEFDMLFKRMVFEKKQS